MTDSTLLLLKLINEGKTINEISEIMKISNKRIFNMLTMIRNKGFEFDRKYYSNGDIVYVPKRSFVEVKHTGVDIITRSSEHNFEALVISDLHIGNANERLDLLYKAYDYCVKEGIHTIIVCGDIIDGMCFPKETIHNNVYDQIDYAIQNYPFDKSILNFAILGNHDYNALKDYGQNLAKIFESYRHDIVSLGYSLGQINIKNDKIIVRHPSDIFENIGLSIDPTKSLVLKGHSHKMKISSSTNVTTVTVPSLSALDKNGNLARAAVRMNLFFKNGVITNGEFSQLVFIDNKIYTASEFECYLGYGKSINNESVGLEEDRVKKKILVPEKPRMMSQIERFNARYKL